MTATNQHFAHQLRRFRRDWGISLRNLERALTDIGLTVSKNTLESASEGRAVADWAPLLWGLESIRSTLEGTNHPPKPHDMADWLWPGVFESVFNDAGLQILRSGANLPCDYLQTALQLRGYDAWTLSVGLQSRLKTRLSPRLVTDWLKGKPINRGVIWLPELGRLLRIPIGPLIPIPHSHQSASPESLRI